MRVPLEKAVAVIGCGRKLDGFEGWAIGHDHAEAWLNAGSAVRLIGVDSSPENLATFGQRFGLSAEDLYPSTDALYASLIPDFVSICTWPRLHAPQTIEAANRGVKGILCEKPIGLSPGEIDQILNACRQKCARLAVAHQRALLPIYQKARQTLRDNVLGTNVVAEFRVGGSWDILSWTVHWFDMANFLFDAEPLSIVAGMDHTGERRYDHPIENDSVIFVEYPGSRQALFITGPDHLEDDSINVRGSEGFLKIGSQLELFTRAGFSVLDLPVLPREGFTAATAELIAAVETSTPMTLEGTRCAQASKMAYAAHEAFRTGRKVHFPIDFQYAPLEVLHNAPTFSPGPLQAVLMADEHFGSLGRDGLSTALHSVTGQPPRLVDARNGLTATDLEGAEILILYHTHQEADETTRRVLEEWVRGGNPLLILHCAVGAYAEWYEFRYWAGRVWKWSGENSSEHPIVESRLITAPDVWWPWRDAWIPSDEVFIKLKDVSPTEELLFVEILSETFPAAWRSTKHRNVATWTSGHRGDSWRIPAMRDCLRQLINILARSFNPSICL